MLQSILRSASHPRVLNVSLLSIQDFATPSTSIRLTRLPIIDYWLPVTPKSSNFIYSLELMTTYAQLEVPNSESETEEIGFSTAKPAHRFSIPWSASSIITVLSLLFNLVLVIIVLRSKEVGGLCRGAIYCEFIPLSLNVCSPPH